MAARCDINTLTVLTVTTVVCEMYAAEADDEDAVLRGCIINRLADIGKPRQRSASFADPCWVYHNSCRGSANWLWF